MDYYISDPHFGHAGIIKFCNRPFSDVREMDRQMTNLWNARVGKDDDVWILGDIVFDRHEDPASYLARLSGRKHLIIGNHDERNVSLVDPAIGGTKFGACFESVDYALRRTDGKGRKIWMSHYPLLEGPRDTWILYGHIHNHRNQRYWNMLREMEQSLNCSVEVNGYMPVTFEELVVNNKRWRAEK